MSNIIDDNGGFTIEFTKLGLEDIFWGVGSQQVTRFGEEYTITEINAGNMPFDASSTLQEVLDTNYPSVEIVGANMAEVIAVGNDIASVITCATNIILIANAEGYALVAQASATAALASENLAKQWATEAEDVLVADGKYSAYHWAQKAEEIVVGESVFLPLLGGTMTGDITMTGEYAFKTSSYKLNEQGGFFVLSHTSGLANYITIHQSANVLALGDGTLKYGTTDIFTSEGGDVDGRVTIKDSYLGITKDADHWYFQPSATEFLLYLTGGTPSPKLQIGKAAKTLSIQSLGAYYDSKKIMTEEGGTFEGSITMNNGYVNFASLSSEYYRMRITPTNGFAITDVTGTLSNKFEIEAISQRLLLSNGDITYNGVTLLGNGADELKELTDVSDTLAPTSNQVLTYNSTTSKWEAADPVGDIPTVTDFTVEVANQTLFTVDYNAQNVFVYVGGVKLKPTEMIATNGTTISLSPQDIGTWVQVVSNSDAPGTIAMEYADLLDVDPNLAPNDGDMVMWNATEGYWESVPNDSANMAFTKAIIFDEVYDNGTKTANFTIIPSTNQYQKVTINADVTMTISPAPAGPCTINLHIYQGATGGTITWPTALWEDGTPVANTTTPTTGHDLLIMQYTGSAWIFGMKKNLS